MDGEWGLNGEGGLLNFPPLKRGGGAYLRGGLNRGFMVISDELDPTPLFKIARSVGVLKVFLNLTYTAHSLINFLKP